MLKAILIGINIGVGIACLMYGNPIAIFNFGVVILLLLLPDPSTKKQ